MFEYRPPTVLQLGVGCISYVLNKAIQAMIMLSYITFWWLLTGSVWERTGSAWALTIPVAVVTFNDWLVLKALVTAYFATALGAWRKPPHRFHHCLWQQQQQQLQHQQLPPLPVAAPAAPFWERQQLQ